MKHQVKHQVKQMAVFQVKRIWSFRLFRRSDCHRVLGVVEIIADDGDDVVVIAVELVPRLVAKLRAVVKEAAT